jgi:hypothetical protein
VVEVELGVRAGGAPSAAADDGESAWEDEEEEDEDLASAMARKDDIENGEIIGDVEEGELNDYTGYAVTRGREASHITISTNRGSDRVTRILKIWFFAASKMHGS